ncbi:transposase [Streptomyces sp. NPDC053780]|uniref:transposase n=1 Tax=unclassified Streptomyces TaxID=2593676 RepID=UPI003443339C
MPARAPRVLGVDEFAFRKGFTYGTVLVGVDVDAGLVMDVLPDRTSETFAAWLKEQPAAEIHQWWGAAEARWAAVEGPAHGMFRPWQPSIRRSCLGIGGSSASRS